MNQNLIKRIALLWIGVSFQHLSLGQVTLPSNIGATGLQYVGWDLNQPFPLNIKHEATQPINFYTSAGAGGLANQRMRIFEGSVNAPNGATINVGRVGIQEDGIRWNTLPVPVSLLQLGQGWGQV